MALCAFVSCPKVLQLQPKQMFDVQHPLYWMCEHTQLVPLPHVWDTITVPSSVALLWSPYRLSNNTAHVTDEL